MDATITATPATVTYASFGARLVALIIDWVVIGVLQSFVVVPVLGLIGIGFIPALDDLDFSNETDAIGFIVATITAIGSVWLLTALISFFYFSVLESSKYQASLGKMAMEIKVTDMDGTRISFGKAVLRRIGKYFSGMFLCIGYIMAAFTEKKQALHDLIASTLVVKK